MLVAEVVAENWSGGGWWVLHGFGLRSGNLGVARIDPALQTLHLDGVHCLSRHMVTGETTEMEERQMRGTYDRLEVKSNPTGMSRQDVLDRVEVTNSP